MTITPEEAQRWRAYLMDWERHVYLPIFAPHHISRDAALIAWATFARPLPPIGPSGQLGN